MSWNFELLLGVESSVATAQPWNVPGKPIGCLDIVKYWHYLETDYRLIAGANVRTARVPVVMEDVIPRKGMRPEEWDWSRYDAKFKLLKELGLDPIVDIMHHVNYPSWMEGGLLDPALPELLRDFALALLGRYGWIDKVTVFNEPLPTAWLAGLVGEWPPFERSDDAFVRICLNVAKAICLATNAIRKDFPHVLVYQNESCEAHRLAGGSRKAFPKDRDLVRFCRQRALLVLDVMFGRMGPDHPLSWYVTPERGFTPEVAEWFRDNRAVVHVLMLDYYHTHEHAYYRRGKDMAERPGLKPMGFARLVWETYWPYVRDFPGMRLMIGETNIIGWDSDKITWLRYMLLECGKLRSWGCPIEGLTWMGVTDSALWCSHLRQPWNGTLEGIGLVHLDHRNGFARSTGEFYAAFAAVAGGMDPRKLPCYRFSEPLDAVLGGYVRDLMVGADWDWTDPPAVVSDARWHELHPDGISYGYAA